MNPSHSLWLPRQLSRSSADATGATDSSFAGRTEQLVPLRFDIQTSFSGSYALSFRFRFRFQSENPSGEYSLIELAFSPAHGGSQSPRQETALEQVIDTNFPPGGLRSPFRFTGAAYPLHRVERHPGHAVRHAERSVPCFRDKGHKRRPPSGLGDTREPNTLEFST
ncbi:hypothetical protein AAFF_G00076040 [Aldrovandia affinis]|uniref:Uncharacterized protein n=1 Tax=Aldrovandia affinis TaxID=143900 RepID=A0AAD7RY70_9TELE|nr:hypothetical protein AAFF_G00076040 [Aldrovandia affinis]